MVPLDGFGVPGKPVSAVDFEGGQASPGEARYPSLGPALSRRLGRAGCW